jgi:hypothetical protein
MAAILLSCVSCAGPPPQPLAETSAVPARAAAADAPGAQDPDISGSAGSDAALPEIAITDWPITWTDERTELMLAYRREHSDPAATDLTITPEVIVLHYTAGGSAASTKRYFDRTRMESGRARLKDAGAVNVSAHFLVDRDGTIYRLQPETTMGRHCIGLNHLAIGVENVGDEDRWKLTDAQIEANAALVRYLAAKHGIGVLVGHHEADRLEGTRYFRELDPYYRNDKPDPGPRFMVAVRARLGDLGLVGAP